MHYGDCCKPVEASGGLALATAAICQQTVALRQCFRMPIPPVCTLIYQIVSLINCTLVIISVFTDTSDGRCVVATTPPPQYSIHNVMLLRMLRLSHCQQMFRELDVVLPVVLTAVGRLLKTYEQSGCLLRNDSLLDEGKHVLPTKQVLNKCSN